MAMTAHGVLAPANGDPVALEDVIVPGAGPIDAVGLPTPYEQAFERMESGDVLRSVVIW